MKDGLPVGGYRPQSDTAIEAVNAMKIMEETVLRMIDGAAGDDRLQADPCWLAVARTHVQQGFMAVNRAIFRPARLSDEDIARLTDGA